MKQVLNGLAEQPTVLQIWKSTVIIKLKKEGVYPLYIINSGDTFERSGFDERTGFAEKWSVS